MDLDRNDDQRQLQEMITRFAADRFPTEFTREIGLHGLDRTAWRELAELGTFGIAVDEQDGGVGLQTIEAVLVHECLGAGLVPGPVVAASMLAGVVAGVIDGSVVPAVMVRNPHGPLVVEHLRDADVLVVIDTASVEVYEAASIDHSVLDLPTDPTTTVSILGHAPTGGDVIGGTELADSLRRVGSVLTSAQLVGISEGATSLALGHASQREQFGRIIGSFQAIKHLLADCWIRTEVARSSCWAAGVTIDEPEAGDVDRALAGARLMSARAATENAKTGIQVQGGMGFTWEVDAHLFLKRAWVLESFIADPDSAAEVLAGRLV